MGPRAAQAGPKTAMLTQKGVLLVGDTLIVPESILAVADDADGEANVVLTCGLAVCIPEVTAGEFVEALSVLGIL